VFGSGAANILGPRWFSLAAPNAQWSTGTSLATAKSIAVSAGASRTANAALVAKSATVVSPTYSRVRRNSTVKYKVQVRDLFNASYLKYAPVKVYRSTNGGRSWKTYKSLSTGSAGAVYWSYRATSNVKFRFYYAGASGKVYKSQRDTTIKLR
jgi:hypothetical protein